MPPPKRLLPPEVLQPLPVVLLFVFLSSLYSLAVPIWEAPDEPSHYLRVRKLAEPGFSPPVYPGPFRTVWSELYLYSSYQDGQPPLYYLAAAGALNGINRVVEPPPPEVLFPPVRPDFGEGRSLFRHPPSPLRRRLAAAASIHFLRLFSVLLGGVTVFLIYRIGRTIWPGEPAAALAAGGFAATLPQFTFISGTVGNDPAAALLGAGTLLYLVGRVGKDRPAGARYYLGLGVLLALGMLTKFNLAFLLPTAAVFIVIKVRDPARGIGLWGALALTAAPLLLISAGSALLFPGEFFWKIRVLFFRLFRVTPEMLTRPQLRHMAWTIYRSFFALFGWMSAPVTGWFYLGWGLLALAAVIGWIANPFGRRGEVDRRGGGLLASAAAFLLLGVIKNNLLVPQSQGRFLFPALGAIAVLFSAGFCRLFPARARTGAARVLLGALAAINLAALFGFIRGLT